MATSTSHQKGELPPDNASRLAIFDSMHMLTGPDRGAAVSEDALFEAVLPRFRVLVPREIHLAGERAYFEEKLRVCIEEGIIVKVGNGFDQAVALTNRPARIRYPDGEVRDYPAGLEPARERLDLDNARLRAADFDVLRFVPSTAEDPNGTRFQLLLASMREQGFLKQFPILEFDDDEVIDGRARIRAAEMLSLKIELYRPGNDARNRNAIRRAETPLNRVLLALYANSERLGQEIWDTVHREVARITERGWEHTAADLALSATWRRTVPKDYKPRFEVGLLPYRLGDKARVQVTADGKVMLRSLLEAAGIAGYKTKKIKEFVPAESARSEHTGGRKADFARADDLIDGIAAMQQDARGRKLKIDPEWEQMREWLRDNFETVESGFASSEDGAPAA